MLVSEARLTTCTLVTAYRVNLTQIFLAVGLLHTRKLLVGVTQDFMLAKKKYAHLVEPLPKRIFNVLEFARKFNPRVELEIYTLSDGLGPYQRGMSLISDTQTTTQ